MRKPLAFLLLAVVLVALYVGDVLARSAAESEVESGIRSSVEGVGGVDARIRSFPFTVRLAAAGQVSTLDIRLTDVVGRGIDVASLRLRIEGLRLERRVLLGGRARITDVDEVTVTASITEAEVRAATGIDVRLLDGRASVTVAGVTADAEVTVTEGRIELRAGGLPAISVPVPGDELLPCAVSARVVVGALLAECTTDRLPPIVIEAIGSVDLGG